MLNDNNFKFLTSNSSFLIFPSINVDTLKTIEIIQVSTETTNFYSTRNEKELLFVIRGNGGVIINTDSSLIKVGDIICIPPYSTRSLANIELEPLQVISIRSMQ